MKKSISLVILFIFALRVDIYGQAKIQAYFNNPVNNSLSTGINAVYLPSGSMADTIVAYINRAKYTLDIAQYDYNQSSNYGAYANIATAVNNAYSRGVTVRWIYDGSSSNTGLSALNSGIHTLGSPTSSAYGIMHDKFIIIDVNSSNPGDAIISTGSEDWSSEMFYKDYNNILFIRDAALAQAFTAEFNMMWGSATATPNSSLSKFGPYKTDLGSHTFTIAGHTVELYFSPSDNTDGHVGNCILTADTDLYVGVYDMTRTGDATDIVTMKNKGVYTLAVVDQYTPTTSSSVNSTLGTGLGTNYVVYKGSYLYHNKMMIVDPSDVCSDPQVLTGSYNWTTSGTQYNDENILIIHNDTLANIYYQSFIQNFTTIGGGSFTTVPGCINTKTSVQALSNPQLKTIIYPNPATSILTISAGYKIKVVELVNPVGQLVYHNEYDAEQVHADVSSLPPGVYFAKINNTEVVRFVKQ
jgi:phospholipase D-like protein/type IX secretion system substrate protein